MWFNDATLERHFDAMYIMQQERLLHPCDLTKFKNNNVTSRDGMSRPERPIVDMRDIVNATTSRKDDRHRSMLWFNATIREGASECPRWEGTIIYNVMHACMKSTNIYTATYCIRIYNDNNDEIHKDYRGSAYFLSFYARRRSFSQFDVMFIILYITAYFMRARILQIVI